MRMEKEVKTEVIRIAAGTAIGTALMWAGFFLGHLAFPHRILLSYRVFLAGIVGATVASGNMLWLAATVQRIADNPDLDLAKKRMKASYSWRMLIQGLWVIAAVTFPCFHWAAGLLPLLFPRITIFFLQLSKGANAPGVRDAKAATVRGEGAEKKEVSSDSWTLR